jgi:hypothetical protein
LNLEKVAGSGTLEVKPQKSLKGSDNSRKVTRSSTVGMEKIFCNNSADNIDDMG